MVEMGLYQFNPDLASLPDMGLGLVRRCGRRAAGTGKGAIVSGGLAVSGVCPQVLDV